MFTRDRWKVLGRFVLETERDKGSKIFVRPSTGRGYTLADAFDVTQTQGRALRRRTWRRKPRRWKQRGLPAELLPVQVTAQEELGAPPQRAAPTALHILFGDLLTQFVRLLPI